MIYIQVFISDQKNVFQVPLLRSIDVECPLYPARGYSLTINNIPEEKQPIPLVFLFVSKLFFLPREYTCEYCIFAWTEKMFAADKKTFFIVMR